MTDNLELELAPYGTAGVVLANGSMSFKTSTEGQIRKEPIKTTW